MEFSFHRLFDLLFLFLKCCNYDWLQADKLNTQLLLLCAHFCAQTDVKEAVPRWGNNSKLVLVSLLLTGLLLAALLVAGYYLKTHRKSSKGVRLVGRFTAKWAKTPHQDY